MNSTKYDEYLAKSIQDQLNRTGITENAFLPREVSLNKNILLFFSIRNSFENSFFYLKDRERKLQTQNIS